MKAHGRWIRRSVIVGVIVAGLLAPLHTARAQLGEMTGIARAMQPEYLRRDMVIFEQALELDATQRVIIDVMFQDYMAAIDEGIKNVHKRFEGMRDDVARNDRARIMALIFQPFEEWSGERDRLGEQFLHGVQTVLTEQQQALWPAFERRLYREKNLQFGRLSGENLNLFDVLRDLKLDEQTNQTIKPVVDGYDTELDQALRNREKVRMTFQNDVMKAMSSNDNEVLVRVQEKTLEAHVAVRNVNDQFIERIAAELPEQPGREFRRMALERGYPSIYRQTPVERMFKIAREMEGLSEEAARTVAEAESAYLAELAQVNRQLLAALRNFDPQENLERAQVFVRRSAGEKVEKRPDPMRDLMSARDDLSRRYARKLQAALTPEQFAKLPGSNRWVQSPQIEHQSSATSAEQADQPRKRKPSPIVNTADE